MGRPEKAASLLQEPLQNIYDRVRDVCKCCGEFLRTVFKFAAQFFLLLWWNCDEGEGTRDKKQLRSLWFICGTSFYMSSCLAPTASLIIYSSYLFH